MTAPIDQALRATGKRPSFGPPRHLAGAPQKLDMLLGHDPLTIRGEHIEKDPRLLEAARAPLAAAKGLREQINKLIGTTTNRAELARAASAQMTRVTRHFDKAVPALETRRDALEKEIAAVITPGQHDPVGVEIRAHFKAQKEPFAAAMKLVEGGDARTTAALLSAPAFLSGLNEEQQATVRAQARVKFAPELHGLATDLDRRSNICARPAPRSSRRWVAP